MPTFKITFARSARKELQNLPVDIAERLLKKIESLAFNARPTGCKKIRGSTSLWRLKVGNYRVVYKVDDHIRIIDVLIIRHRRDVYR